MTNKRKFLTILILGMITAIGPFSIDMYLPAFADIATDLHSNVGYVSLSLSSFFIGICLGQFIYGPLLDRFGRKKPLFAGLLIYLLASVLCALVKSADMLIALRFLQALGGCAGMVASRAMVRDIFSVADNAKIFSMLMLVVGISPIIAPTLGGFVTVELGWHYIFIILALMALMIILAVHFGLPESRQADPSYSLKPADILKNFALVLKEPQFYTYAFTGATAAAGLYAYIAGSPAVFLQIFKVTEKQYGLIFALVAGGLIIATQMNRFLLHRYSSEQVIPVALFVQCLAGIGLFAGSLTGLVGLTGTILLLLLFLSCQGFTFPNSSALCMAPFAKHAGSASALMGAVQMGLGAISSGIVSMLSNGTALPMTGVMACCAIISFIILHVGKRMIRYKATQAMVANEAVDLLGNT
jgi:DHA1 family bicyclomycin/chloramphenicol resistance-like MFS transporter